MSHNYGERVNLLLVQVFAASSVPSTEKPVCLHGHEEESEGGWEDIDEDENDVNASSKPAIICSDSDESEASQSRKKQKTAGSSEQIHFAQNESEVGAQGDPDDGPRTNDVFTAYLDPDVLRDLLESARLLPMSEASAFFLLMTFPFYEHEWDLVGYVLQEVFGAGSDGETESDQD